MNILDKEDKSVAPGFNKIMTKCERFSWAEPGPEGDFMRIDKRDLNIDGDYQRDQVSEEKVRRIAREWDWKLFGTLIVSKRTDGSYWIVEGGHRCRAAYHRKDITLLPCMVFDAKDKKTEAKAFVGANTMKSSVSAYHKHKASVLAEEPIAIAAENIMKKHCYYAVHSNSSGNRKDVFGMKAINTLHALIKEDRELAEATFDACAFISHEEKITNTIMTGLFECQKLLKGKADILHGEYLLKLATAGVRAIDEMIRREVLRTNTGGGRVYANAILEYLNKGRRKRNRLSFDD